MLNILNCLLFFILFVLIIDQIHGAYSSAGVSYRASTYRASTYSASSYTTYRYRVKPELKRRYGGLTMQNKNKLFIRGSVYIWPGMNFHVNEGNLEKYAICEGKPRSKDLNGTFIAQYYSYFICPSTASSNERFCCGPVTSQQCCSYFIFSSTYGTRDDDDESNIGGIVGGVITCLIVIGLIIVFIACRRSRRHSDDIVEQEHVTTTATHVTQAEYKPVPTVDQPIYPVGPEPHSSAASRSQYHVGPGPQYPVGPGSQYPVGPGTQYPVGPGPQYPLGPGTQYSVGQGPQYSVGSGPQYPVGQGTQYPVGPEPQNTVGPQNATSFSDMPPPSYNEAMRYESAPQMPQYVRPEPYSPNSSVPYPLS